MSANGVEKLRIPIRAILRADWAETERGTARVPRARLPMNARRSIYWIISSVRIRSDGRILI